MHLRCHKGSSSLERRVYTHFCRIEQQGIASLCQWSVAAPAVTGIALGQIGPDRLQQHRRVSSHRLGVAARGPRLQTGGDEQLGRCIRTNHCADISAIKDRAGRLTSKITLGLQQSSAHRWVHGHFGCRLANRVLGQKLRIKRCQIKALGDRGAGLCIIQVATDFQHLCANSPVKQPGIKMSEPKMAGQTLGKRPLARGRRTIDREDEGLNHGSTDV